MQFPEQPLTFAFKRVNFFSQCNLLNLNESSNLIFSCRPIDCPLRSRLHIFGPDMKCSECPNLTFYDTHVASQWGVAPRSFAVGRCLMAKIFFSKIANFGLDVKGYGKTRWQNAPDRSIGLFRAFLVHSCCISISSNIHFCPDMKCSECLICTFSGRLKIDAKRLFGLVV